MPSESKLSEPLSIIEVQKIICEPNLCKVSEHLNIFMQFTSSNKLHNAYWEIKVFLLFIL